MNYSTMTIEELEAKNIEFMQQIDSLREQHAVCAVALDQKIREKALMDKFSGLSAEELDTLKKISQAAGPLSIPSGEVVNTPGKKTD